MFNSFKPTPTRQMRNNDNCKIKIKNTSQGKTIEFSGQCSKEQIQMAKMNLMDGEETEEKE